MTLLPMLLIATYLAWRIYRETTSMEASRQFARIDYKARSRQGRR